MKDLTPAQAWAMLPQTPGCHALSLAFSRSLEHLLGQDDPLVLWVAYGLMADLDDGQGCWSTEHAAERVDQHWHRLQAEPGEAQVRWPASSVFLESFADSTAVGEANSDAPLIVDQGQIYLRKMFQAEHWIARSLLDRLSRPLMGLPAAANLALPKLFSYSQGSTEDLQCLAAVNAWAAPVALLAGGPGTGKTYTVVNYLALAILASPEPPRILLLAPTGKAATRLAESVQQAKQRLDLSPDQLAAIPDEGLTLHRALGLGGRGGPHRDRHDPLDADIVVVDETSMVDLVMMAQLLDAVAPQAKLLLVGDAHQLASVQAGAVFGDLCLGSKAWNPTSAWKHAVVSAIEGEVAAPSVTPTLPDVTVHLQESRRYDPKRGIGRLARALLAGDAPGCLELLRDPDETQVQWIQIPEDAVYDARRLWVPLLARCREGYATYWQAQGGAARLAACGHFQVLCAARGGILGVQEANARIWAEFLDARRSLGESDASLRAMTIMMNRNDYATGLFNGDVGVIERGSDQGLRAYFDKQGRGEEPLSLSVARIGGYDPAFAMTIHKSQGSEFDQVMILLGDQPGPGLTRELLYTAVTRAKQGLCIVASPSVIISCAQQVVSRRSGLQARLQPPG